MDYYVMKNQKRLRCGITTGTCASAAAKAAAAKLLLGVDNKTVCVHTPKGVDVSVPVFLSFYSAERAAYKVVKDSGDDPDVTNHAEIFVSVEKGCTAGEAAGDWSGFEKVRTAGEAAKERPDFDKEDGMEPAGGLWEQAFQSREYPFLYLDGGIGVGRITRDGMEQKKGQAAINATPRQMIFRAVHAVCELAEYTETLRILVWVPDGKALAKRTFNPRLGIDGGISILGTSGMIEPMSEKAIVDTIETQIRQLHQQGETKLLVTPGNYGQAYASNYLGLELADSVKCSNYIGETLDLAVSYEMHSMLLVGNIGKLVKLAAGIMNTHSRVADARGEIFAVHTLLCGGERALALKMLQCVNTDEMLQLLEEHSLRQQVCDSICRKLQEHIAQRVGGRLAVGVFLFSERFGFLGQTEQAGQILQQIREEK